MAAWVSSGCSRPVARTLDAMRGTLADLKDSDPVGTVVALRFKNRYKKRLFNGYADGLYNVAIHLGGGVWHVCEVQLHLASIAALKSDGGHRSYVMWRNLSGQ